MAVLMPPSLPFEVRCESVTNIHTTVRSKGMYILHIAMVLVQLSVHISHYTIPKNPKKFDVSTVLVVSLH